MGKKILLLLGFMLICSSVVAEDAPADPSEVAKAIAENEIALEARRKEQFLIAAEEAGREKQRREDAAIRAEAAKTAAVQPPPARPSVSPILFQAPDGSLAGSLFWVRRKGKWVLEFTGDAAKSAQVFFRNVQQQAEGYLTVACPASDLNR